MGLTSLFLDMIDKNVLIIGTGSVGIRRTRRFLDAGANVSIITKNLDDKIRKEFQDKGAKFYEEKYLDELIDTCDLVVVATDDLKLNQDISIKAQDKLVNCASDISLSNVIVPSTFNIGPVTVSLYTGSKSPLMAKELRKKIQKIITEEDIMNIELQEYLRILLKEHIPSQKERKQYMISINSNSEIQELLKNGELEKAKTYVKNIILN
ncbi:bifunctional precorrin-2 dehydrogenase/sirohydrochlorin ferrochelatase [Methanosphaera sp. WGK6]|uniref:precorrin-2 dehydrogenase/sirohydrochlorin ferrochelatase family protein n=1 Tax=Methanosphaera sp. WGK6 TaxID=1561964 RepID=UPI00084CA46E|nr:bifunctional precorrin-2 dehydrogenase/sirohydrochlorin ferrochelatase [Methanosphaera sp. WGK6]OED29950.1 hypothetical protein NL43_05200 [Methanosphaera sp. WGK6]